MSGSEVPYNDSSIPPATRIDGPHRTQGADPAPSSSEPETSAGELALSQASELAAHLRSQQRDLDRREAQLNARTAQLEKDLRASRLWLQERERHFAEREAEFEQQVRQLREQATGLGAAEISAELEAKPRTAEETSVIQDGLRDGTQGLVPEMADHENRPGEQLSSQGAVLEPLELDSPEALLEETLKQIELQRAELARERQQHQQTVTQAQKTLDTRRQRLKAEYSRQSERLKQRSGALERRSAALDQLHAEVAQLHQQALETRLVVQQVWVQLSERFEVAKLAQAVNQARQSLDDHYQLQRNKQRQQREELTNLAERLDKRRRELTEQQTQLAAWTGRRNEEMEEQAARLVAREQELDRQQRQFENLKDQWREEKHRYQRQICELAGRLSRLRPAA